MDIAIRQKCQRNPGYLAYKAGHFIVRDAMPFDVVAQGSRGEFGVNLPDGLQENLAPAWAVY